MGDVPLKIVVSQGSIPVVAVSVRYTGAMALIHADLQTKGGYAWDEYPRQVMLTPYSSSDCADEEPRGTLIDFPAGWVVLSAQVARYTLRIVAVRESWMDSSEGSEQLWP